MKISNETLNFNKILNPLGENKKIVILFLIRNVHLALQTVFGAFLMKNIIDALQENNINKFFIIVGILSFSFALTIIPSHFFRKNREKLSKNIFKSIYNIYITKYFLLENNLTDTLGTGYFNNVIQKGADNWTSLLTTIVSISVQSLIRILFAIGLMTYYLGIWGFFAIIFFSTCSFLIAYYGNRKITPIRRKMREYLTEADINLTRLIMSKFEILQNKKFQFELKTLSNIYDNVMIQNFKQSYRKIYIFDLQKSGIMLFQLISVALVGYGIYHGRYSLGLLTLCWMLGNQINGAIQDLNDNINQFYSQIIYVEKLRETFDDAPVIQGYDTGKNFLYKKGDISIDNITYDYGQGEVLKDFNLKIQGGKKTALVGISGSGKSTLIKLIAGYIHPQFGSISVDKQELPNGQNDDFVSLQSYYQYIGYLTQEPNVFDGTIYDNLTYALDDNVIDDDIINQIIESSQCQFIYDFPEGLQTHIGEKGIKLSGGQRQRLAIAKIMLKNPQIILLDEPTSALDSFSEEEVTKALHNLFVGKTVIVIAHRLQTVKQADEIIVLESGKIVERGNHNELVKHGGQYAKMLELQSGF